MVKGLFKDIVRYFPSKIVPAIVGIISIPIFTRLFPSADYGNYILVTGVISVMSIIPGWVNISVIRFYPFYENKGESTSFTEMTFILSFLTILMISTISFIVVLLTKNIISGDFYHLLKIGIIVFILLSFFEILLSFLRIKRLINWYSGFYVWKSITAFIFGVLFVIFFRLGVEGLLWGTILSICLAIPFLWKIAIRKLQIRNMKMPSQSIVEMAKYSFPLMIGNLSAWILSLSDRYILYLFRGSQEVGIYSISYQISDHSIMLFTSLFAFAFNPLSIIVWEKHGKEKSQEFVAQGTRYYLLLCTPAVIGISVLREPILRIFSTPNFYEGAKIIPFVVLGVFILGLNQRFGAGLSFYKKTHFYMYSLIISGLINLGLNILFIPKYGYIAAAVTTLVSYGILLSLNIVFSRQFFFWRFPFNSLINSLSASVLMGAIVYFIANSLTSSTFINLISGISIGTAAYFLILLLLGEFSEDEIQILHRLKRKIFE